MFTPSRDDVPAIEWGGGTCERLLTAKDNMGFAVAHTVVRADSEFRLHYRNHLEACYCIGGSGEVEDTDSTFYPINPGTI